jgi:hypothetical protein
MTYYDKEASSYVYYSEVIPSELIDMMIKEIKIIDPDSFLVGTTANEEEDSPNLKNIRDSTIYWLQDDHWICSMFRHYFEKANRECWEYDLAGIESIQVSKYDQNGHYNWHCDYGLDDSAYTRKLSASLLISDESEYDGGELQLIDYHANITSISRTKGSITIFDSRLPHRVSKVLSGTRLSLVTWMRGPKLR